MKTFSWIVTREQRGRKLGDVLRSKYGLSRRQLIRLKKQPGSVLVNGQPVYLGTSLKPGDSVRIVMEEHLEPAPPQPILLDIAYEDADILVLNKPAGLVSHPTKGYADGTLANALSYYWQSRGAEYPARIVTRLDKETSGLVLVAKTAWCHHRLSQTEIHKEYLAIARGIPDPPQGEIDLPIGRNQDNPKKRGIDPLGRPALTRYRILATGNNLALVHLVPFTGRTHQLRIHMAHIGCPLVDDFMYGTEEGLVGRTALHAHKLRFSHPQTNETMIFSAPIPADFSRVGLKNLLVLP
jgi:23S rRNA pseudouridine1911/1915/1917 synthase